MKKVLLNSVLAVLIAFNVSFAGNQVAKKLIDEPVPEFRACYTMENLDRLMKEDPTLRDRMTAIEKEVQRIIAERQKSGLPQTQAFSSIKVWFNVLYNTSAQNVSLNQLNAQIDVLNKDFSATNTDVKNVPSVWKGLVANTGVQFVLSGVTRKFTTKTSWRADDSMKRSKQGGIDPHNTSEYLNIWVCNLGGGLLGYAQFPGGNPNTDGVVILYSSLPRGSATNYNLGRTATHEVGHYLDLYHIWGDDGTGCNGSDKVDDTPNAAGPNYGCPSFPSITCNNGPNGDMWMNYMDYTYDKCMYMFTLGQSARVSATLNGVRASLVDGINKNAVARNLPSEFNLAPNFPNPFNPTTSIGFDLAKDEFVTLSIYNVAGQLVRTLVNENRKAGSYSVIWNGRNENGVTVPSGMYIYKIKAGSYTKAKKMTLMK